MRERDGGGERVRVPVLHEPGPEEGGGLRSRYETLGGRGGGPHLIRRPASTNFRGRQQAKQKLMMFFKFN
jgi:hypothetical protein